MTSQDRIDLVRTYYDLVDAKDDSMFELFHPESTYERPGYKPLEGRAEIEDFYRQDRVIESGSHSLETVIASDNLVAVEGSFSGVLRDGRDVTIRFAEFFEIEDSKFLRRRSYFFVPSV